MRQGCLGLVAVVLLAGCSLVPAGESEGTASGLPSPVMSSAPTPSASTVSTPPASPTSEATTTPPAAPLDDSVDSSEGAELVWDEATRATAVAAAEAVMGAFARPDLPYEQWWAGVEPLLSSAAAEVYSSVDPANIPVRTVTGPGAVVEESSPYVAWVEVPTDVGTYTVLLSRETTAGWLGERITPPEGLS